MPNLSNSLLQIHHLETINEKQTVIHRMEPGVKLIITLIYLIAVISVNPWQVSLLLSFLWYPILGIILGEIPFTTIGRALRLAMPFALFAGLSNLVFNREIAFTILNIVITQGMLSFCSLMLKSIFTILAVLILIATTGMDQLLYVLIGFKVPTIIVTQIMMTYRYISIITEEGYTMYQAYILRAPREKGIKLKDMGPFLGQLMIRSFDRAERVYQAMNCRGFKGYITFSRRNEISGKGWLYILIIGGILIILRLVNIPLLLGEILL